MRLKYFYFLTVKELISLNIDDEYNARMYVIDVIFSNSSHHWILSRDIDMIAMFWIMSRERIHTLINQIDISFRFLDTILEIISHAHIKRERERRKQSRKHILRLSYGVYA